MHEYRVVRDHQVGKMRVLELDRDFDSFTQEKWTAEIDGQMYKFALNSIRHWLLIEATGNFSGKIVIIH